MKIKRVIAVVIVLSMLVLSVLPYSRADATVYTSGLYKYTVTDGEATLVEMKSSTSKEVWLKEELGGYPLVAIGEKAFLNRSNYQTIKIPGSIKTIGREAFKGCTNLTTITLEEGVQTIEYGAFKDLAKLETVNAPASLQTIGDYAFYGCTKLKTQPFGEGLQTIGEYAFYQCRALPKLNLGENLKSIGAHAFESCIWPEIDLPDSLESIGDFAFWNCLSVTKVSIGKGLRQIGTAGMAQIAAENQGYEVDPANAWFCADAQGVLYTKDMTEVVRVPTKLAGTYQIANGAHTVRDYAFYGCVQLTGLVMPDSLKTIGNYAFQDCIRVNSLQLGKNIQTIGNRAFYNLGTNYSLDVDFQIVIPDSVITIGEYVFSGVQCAELLLIGNNVQSIGNRAFVGVGDVKTMVVSAKLQQIDSNALYAVHPEHVIYCGTQQQQEAFFAATSGSANYTDTVWQLHDIVPATCTTAESCRYCKEEFAPPLGHDYASEVTAPTCTAGGYTTHTCSRCSDSYTDSYTDRKEHAWQDGGCTGCDLTAEVLDLSGDQRVSVLDPSFWQRRSPAAES